MNKYDSSKCFSEAYGCIIANVPARAKLEDIAADVMKRTTLL